MQGELEILVDGCGVQVEVVLGPAMLRWNLGSIITRMECGICLLGSSHTKAQFRCDWMSRDILLMEEIRLTR